MTKTLVGLLALCSISSAFSFSAVRAGTAAVDQLQAIQAQKLEAYCKAGLQTACNELLISTGAR